MEVIILVPAWRGTVGRLEGAIPGTDWFNVRVAPDLRLALRRDEFAGEEDARASYPDAPSRGAAEAADAADQRAGVHRHGHFTE